jgi:hypothetical protein
VIPADNGIALQLADRKWREAVRTAINEAGDLSIFGPVKKYRLAQ